MYGYDDPIEIATHSHLNFIKEYDMTPQKYINELQGSEKIIFEKLFAGKISSAMYKMYEYKKDSQSN